MKFIICFIILTAPLHSLYAQKKSKQLSHYVFSEFEPGKVLMKNGVANAVSLNYNALSEEMVFENNGEKLAIVDQQLKDIDTVFIADRKFIRLENKFLELVNQSSIPLYVEHKCRVKYPGKVNGPGGQTSQTSSSETYAPTDFRRIIYEIVLPKGYSTSAYKQYWITKDEAFIKFKTMNQLVKLYPAKKKSSKAFIKNNDIEFNNPKDILKLIQFLEEN